MVKISPEFIERYQEMLEKDPNSQVFAPLAEAYRQMGLIDEGLEVCEAGVKKHPHFAGGRVALARLYLASQRPADAVEHLEKAIELSPENVLAHSLRAETFRQLKEPKRALEAYKMLLFLNPQHEQAQLAVKKLESLTADEFSDDVFAMKRLDDVIPQSQSELGIEDEGPEVTESRHLERYVSLADAFIVRGDYTRALKTLNDAEEQLGPSPEIIKRLKLIQNAQSEEDDEDAPPPPQRPDPRQEKIDLLRELLQKVDSYKISVTAR
ncbi:MAG: tetratricopeptide repeat protein [Pseudobdellovibrionaceae bacterium]|nr:tetratricopeptide repeat protein [Bdellovibrionales bacterium]USN48779.1 MAG: tetratricopeptide repeat protein [Pseudobdellovibrionaceae bacterium]